MLIVLRKGAGQEQITPILQALEAHGLRGVPMPGAERTNIAVLGVPTPEDAEAVGALAGVVEVVRVSKPYKLCSRETQAADTVVQVGSVRVGGGTPVVIAGPCSVETREQTLAAARAVRAAGAHMLRGGAFKPSTSPYQFRGLGEEGLRILAEARAETGLPIVTEVMSPDQVELVCRYADVLQVGARNMQNHYLLDAVGRTDKPVLLKRGMSALVEEWLLSAEYIMSAGNHNVILCERGIRTFERATRNTFDLSVVPLLKDLTHLPVLADPSHGTGLRDLVAPMALAALTAGADGLIVEVHPQPELALKDGAQSLTPAAFATLMEEVRALSGFLAERRALRHGVMVPA